MEYPHAYSILLFLLFVEFVVESELEDLVELAKEVFLASACF